MANCNGFAGRFQEALNRDGRSQREVGRLMGVSHSTIGKWLEGSSQPTVGQAHELSAILYCDEAWLMTGIKTSIEELAGGNDHGQCPTCAAITAMVTDNLVAKFRDGAVSVLTSDRPRVSARRSTQFGTIKVR